jgi:hypothetical protein
LTPELKRKVVLGAVVVVAAAYALFNIFATKINLMMRPSGGGIDDVLAGSAIAVVAVTAAALVPLVRTRIPAYWFVGVAALAIGISFIPTFVYGIRQDAVRASVFAERQKIDRQVSDRIAARSKDVEARIKERRPYTPKEAFDVLFTVSTSDLRYQGTGEHSAAAFAMLRRALSEKIIDPNAIAHGVHPLNKEPEPLFLLYYRGWVKPAGGRREIGALDWTIMTLFVEYGADLTLPAARAFAEDLRRTATPIRDGRYIELK